VASDLLLLAAFQPELAPLRATLGDAMAGRVQGLLVTARAVGIGLPAAAVGAAMHVAEIQPRAVLMLGTCGAYAGAEIVIGDVVVAQRVLLVDPSSLMGTTQFPEPMSVAMHADRPLSDALAAAGARRADVATTLAVTVDDVTAERIGRGTGAQVEHLEAHGVATACAARGIPFAAVLGVANFVGARARSEWRLHHREASAAAVECALRWITSGAAGLDRLVG
jgi:nucleoside phosphorylase